jgi:hypothetical protein
MKTNLLSINADSKTSKGNKIGYLTGILYLVPAGQAGLKNLCPKASKGCIDSCLFTAGRGKFSKVESARIKKTQFFLSNRKAFLDILRSDLQILQIEARKLGLKPAVRLNGTSDIAWHKLIDFESFPDIQFYDYTKVKTKAIDFARGKLPKNYYVVFSRSESNWSDCLQVLKAGGNVAAVFRDKLPLTYERFPVLDGDKTDARFLDERGCIIGLKAKGKAKQDKSNFVV